MSMTALVWEMDDRTILAALRFIDAVTGKRALGGARITAPTLTFYRKPGGDIIVTNATRQGDHELVIDPDNPAFLPRRATLTLPRSSDRSAADAIFKPREILLLPSPSYPLAGNMAGLLVTARRSSDNQRIRGALARLVRTGEAAFAASTTTNAAGEALIPVPSAPIFLFNGGGPPSDKIAAELDILVDPAAARFIADGDVVQERQRPFHADPDALEARRPALKQPSVTVTLEAGRVKPWPPP